MRDFGRIEQLKLLTKVTWDGDLISKSDRDELVKEGLAVQKHGWNFISPEGIDVLHKLGILRP